MPKTKIVETKIRYNRNWNEYVVQAYGVDGERMPEADYYTDDKQDAEQTAKAMVE